jgi:putative nucleotidyltransferase with HDIG domain
VASAADLAAEFSLTGVTALVRGAVAQIPQLLSVHRLTFPVYVPLLATLLYISNDSFVAAVVFLTFALSAQKLLLLYLNEKETAGHLVRANARLRSANVRFMTNLVGILEGSDPYTNRHSLVVARYARDIAERMGLSEDERRLAHLCGLVHDIGKYKIDSAIIKKAGPLTLEERRLIEMHPEWGEELIRSLAMEEYGDTATIVRHHHEWIDGKGYPDGLTENEIPLLSKIISVADAYNAMTSDRPYRDAMPSRVARLRLAQAVGTQFDTSVVAAFEAILTTSDEDYRTGSGQQFDLVWNDPRDDEVPELIRLQAVS